MGDVFRDRAESAWSQSTVGTNAGATLTITGVTGKRLVLESYQVSGDAAALLTITYTKAGVSTTQKVRYSAAFVDKFVYPPGAIVGDTATNITLALSASTANCEVNATGVQEL